MAATDKNTFEQVYNTNEGEDLASKVSHVVCVLVQRGIFVAGFGATKELLTIHYTGYNSNKTVWDLDFFEHIISQESLFTNKEKVRAVFIGNEKNLIVPDALYDEKSAKQWLKRIHYSEAKDMIEAYPIDEDKAVYLNTIPFGISELIKINFRKASVLPLAAYQFRNTRKQSLYLQCCLTSEQVFATMHNYSQLLWHQVFDYSSAEDIAYSVKHFCIENNISPSRVSLRCDAICAAQFDVLNVLSQYFPGIRTGRGDMNLNWDAAVSLAQQLMECV